MECCVKSTFYLRSSYFAIEGKKMSHKKCKKCHIELKEQQDYCEDCNEQPSKLKTIMAWFCIILLLAAGMIWAFTDSEPDVSVAPPVDLQEGN